MSEMDLETRVRRLEDRNAIIDIVIKYATTVDAGDWTGLASIFTDPVHVDFSEAGMPAADFPRDQFVSFAEQGLAGWTARQHLSPNHQVEFGDDDPNTALCRSYMYAQHYLKDAPGGEFYLMRGSYDNYMVRSTDGWKITRVVQHISWLEGNRDALQSTPGVT